MVKIYFHNYINHENPPKNTSFMTFHDILRITNIDNSKYPRLKTIVFKNDDELIIYPKDIPDSVTKLKFRDWKQKMSRDIFPKNLEKILILGESYPHRITKNMLPLNLKKLDYPPNYPYKIKKEDIPINIESLLMPDFYKFNLEPNMFPKSLIKLSLDLDKNIFLGINDIPNSVKNLYIRFSKSNHFLVSGIIPSSVEILEIYGSNITIDTHAIPNSVTKLIIGHLNKNSLNKLSLPTSIKILCLCSNSNKNIIKKNILPNGIEDLSLECKTVQLYKNYIPNSVKKLSIKTPQLEIIDIPSSIREINLKITSVFDNIVLKKVYLKHDLEKLTLVTGKDIKNISFPKKIQNLKLKYEVTMSFLDKLPNDIESLYIEYLNKDDYKCNHYDFSRFYNLKELSISQQNISYLLPVSLISLSISLNNQNILDLKQLKNLKKLEINNCISKIIDSNVFPESLEYFSYGNCDCDNGGIIFRKPLKHIYLDKTNFEKLEIHPKTEFVTCNILINNLSRYLKKLEIITSNDLTLLKNFNIPPTISALLLCDNYPENAIFGDIINILKNKRIPYNLDIYFHSKYEDKLIKINEFIY